MTEQNKPFSKEVRERLIRSEIRPLGPGDYRQWLNVANSAWVGISEINKEWDFVALTKDSIASPGLFSEGRLIGASLNLVKANTNSQYLLVHMLAVHGDYQGLGLGFRLMEANYDLIKDNILGEGVQTVKLTSDPFDVRNVGFYLHRCHMHSNTYIDDAYKTLNEEGAGKHRGLPADRLYYVCQPNSLWSQIVTLPNQADYEQLISRHPELLLETGNNFPIVLVQTPSDIEKLKGDSLEQAVLWRLQQRNALTSVFERGYTAVDCVTISGSDRPRCYIVCLRGFDQSKPFLLEQQVKNLIK